MDWKTPLFKSYWDEDDVNAVSKVIRRGTFWAAGPEVTELENKIASYVGLPYAVTFNSGTSALHSALLAHGITSGEVIVPSFTFISTASCVLLAGAKPTFAEIEEQSYGLDPEDVKEKITKKTKAITPVHYGGAPCGHIKALREIADDHNLIFLEDAAESLGSKKDNKMVGTFGDSSMFSFCQNKIITAGEGGVIVTDNKDVYQKLKYIRSHGRQENKANYFTSNKELDYIEIGYNFRMSSLSASLVYSQLQKIQKIVDFRRQKAQYYNQQLKKNKNIRIPFESKDSHHVYQMYTIQFNNHKNRETVREGLTKAKIMTRVYFEPVHLKTLYKETFKYKKGDLPETERIAKKVLTIPLYPTISKSEMDYIIKNILNCCK